MKRKLLELNSLWTHRAVLWIEFAVAMAWLGLFLQNGRIILSSAIIFSYLILTLALSSTPHRKISLGRQLSSDRILEEESVVARTSIKNEGDYPVLVHGSDEYPTAFTLLKGGENFLMFVRPGSHKSIRALLRAEFRGHYILPPTQVKSTDEFGLREVDLARTERPSYLSVLPPVEDMSDFDLESRNAQPEIGTFRSGSVGVGTEFFGIRDYLPGDELRRINWKASARSESLLSNEYEREHVTNIYLMTDLTATSLEDLKWTVRVSASVATYLLRTRNRLGLVVIGESVYHTRIESGRRQLLRVLDKLITAEPGGTGESSAYLMRLIDEMPPCELLVVSMLNSENIPRTLIEIRHRGKRVLVITRSVPEIQSGSDALLRAAADVYALNRASIIHRLRNAEVDVVEVPTGASLRGAFSIIKERPVRH